MNRAIRKEEGTVRRYLKDLKLGTPAIGYDQFMMLPDNPLGAAVEVSNIAISGNTATFTLQGVLVTAIDNGPGFANDSIVINDGIREYPLTLFDGDLKIIRNGK